jgi:hypothetical protein
MTFMNRVALRPHQGTDRLRSLSNVSADSVIARLNDF